MAIYEVLMAEVRRRRQAFLMSNVRRSVSEAKKHEEELTLSVF